MKILIAVDHFKDGGAERVASIIINQLGRKNELHVAALEPDVNYPLDKTLFQFHVVDYNRTANAILKQWGKLRGLRRVFREIRPEKVVAFGYYMSAVSYFTLIMNGRRSVKLITSERTDPTREPQNKWYARLRTFVYAHSDLLVCQTDWVKSFFENKLKTEMVVIPNPITPNLPSWSGSDSYTILTACRLVPQKNLPLLIKAFKMVHNKFPKYRLRILGEGILRSLLEDQIKRAGLSKCVEMPGFSKLAHNEMINCFMYVSSSDYEGISNSMLEALGCGVPTICTDCPVGGASMFIKHGVNGLLVPVGDANALAEAMITFIVNKDFAQRCGRNAIEINQKIDAGAVAKEWEKSIFSV